MNFNIIKDIDNYIKEIIELDNEFYDEEYMWDDLYQKEVYDRNKDSFIAVTENNKLVGYLNYLNISDKVYNQELHEDTIVDKYDLNDILPFGKENNILINSIVIDKKYQDTDIIKFLTDGFLIKLKDLEEKGYHIKTISGTAVSPDGQKSLRNLGLTDVKTLANDDHLFINDKDPVKDMENKINSLKEKSYH